MFKRCVWAVPVVLALSAGNAAAQTFVAPRVVPYAPIVPYVPRMVLVIPPPMHVHRIEYPHPPHCEPQVVTQRIGDRFFSYVVPCQ